MPLIDSFKGWAMGWALKEMQKAEPGGRQGGNFLSYPLTKKPVWTKWTTEKAVDAGFKASLWVYASINKKAKAAASVPWYVYQRDGNGDYQQIPNHPLQQLMDKPNPFTSRNNLVERMIMQLDLAGNSIFHIVKVNDVPVQLWNIHPDYIAPVPDDIEFISRYDYRDAKTGRISAVPPEDVLHVMYVDPSDPYWGIAPLQVAARTVDTDTEALNWNKVALQNRAVTDGIFSVPQPLTSNQYEELRKQIRQQHQGSKNARTPWLLGGGASWQQMSLSPADMDFIAGRQMTREEICAAFQVPPPLVGILDKANYSNMKEARRVFWLDTIIPLLDDLKESFNRALTPYFGDDIVLDYDTSGVDALAENMNEKIEAANKLFTMGVPFNQINQRLELGIDEIEGGDIGYLPASLMPANMAAALAAGQIEREQPADDATNLATDAQGDEEPKGKKHKSRILLKGYNLQTPEQKALYWKAVERQRGPWDRKFQSDVRKLFDQERKAVVRAFKESGNLEDAIGAIDQEKWEQLYVRNLRGIIADFGTATFEGFKSHFPQMERKALDFDPYSRLILDYIFKVTALKVTYVTDFTIQLIRGIIYTGRDNNDTIDTIARDIDKSFEDFSTHRSWRIARTEVSAASNYGSYMAAEQASAETGDLVKEWIDSGDDRVRESHERVGGETAPLYSRFRNGLLYPGDMENGSAKEVIHCRCTLAYQPVAYTRN